MMDIYEATRHPQSAIERIAELEIEVKLWKDSYTTAQIEVDTYCSGLAALTTSPHGCAADLVAAVKAEIAEWGTLATDINDVRQQLKEMAVWRAERDTLLASVATLRGALEKIPDVAIEAIATYCRRTGRDFVEGLRSCVELQMTYYKHAALANPATTEALERVKAEARADLMRVVVQAMLHPEDLPEVAQNKEQDDEYQGIRGVLRTTLERVRKDAKVEVLKERVETIRRLHLDSPNIHPMAKAGIELALASIGSKAAELGGGK